MKSILSIVAFVAFFTVASSSFAQQVLDQRKIETIEILIKLGSMKFDYELEKAWVSPAIWDQYNVDAKENFTIYSALYVRHRQKNTKMDPVIDMYDYKSGKHLASYGPIMGFRIKE